MKLNRLKYTRREFIKKSSAASAGLLIAAPTVLTAQRVRRSTEQGKLIFQPHFVQSGRGPHLLNWAYASDSKWDAMHSNIMVVNNQVVISDSEGEKKFGIDVRWNVEGFGYIFITADNGGEYYQLPPSGKTQTLNLNYELAKSRVIRNQKRYKKFVSEGWKPSRDVQTYIDLSSELYQDATKIKDEAKRSAFAQKSLYYAMWGSEMMELDKANFDIARRGKRNDFYIGCDARAIMQMDREKFLDLFSPLFSFAMVTYFVGSSDFHSDIEPQLGDLRFDTRDVAVNSLNERGITVEGRGIYWFHKWTTPGWLKDMSFDALKMYVENHTREIIQHYPAEKVPIWEVMNEFHDWANEVHCTPDQTIELTKLAYDVARDTNSKVKLTLNNCCPFAEYVALGEYSSGCVAEYPQRTPWEYTKDCIDAGVDFDIVAQQMYFPYRDLQDIVINIERLGEFGKPVQLSEIGCPGGPTTDTVKTGKYKWPTDPFVWHREWDEELAADWMESMYTLSYAKPFVEGAVWFDFVDPYAYIDNGSLLRSPRGDKKAGYIRLEKLLERWGKLNKSKS